ncbi:hypothetical protein LCGC14_1180750 [marine sediment metagenome]|uniref:Elp3/MiaA/NifB-like radical SAM core domain-containing protein n=1 Tax=marine sediment metagenome TaxID=412755 RepID=A0A0F9P539_9ZZZZ
MRVNLLTDAPRHNLALMKIASYHRARGDEVTLNSPQTPCDLSYGSWLFNQNYPTDHAGGPAVDPRTRLNGMESVRPDYDLFPIDYSLGYTWRYCPRRCDFCVVPKQDNPKDHHSIWEFHDPRFDTICLLNNNTFSDPQWFDTFVEIWDAGLRLMEHGFDLRLMDIEHAKALKRTKIKGNLHFAWDSMNDETAIIRGLDLCRQFNIRGSVYVLVGYDTTRQEDILRCEVVDWFGLDPYIMPYNGGSRSDRAFKRAIDLRFYRRYPTITDALGAYR